MKHHDCPLCCSSFTGLLCEPSHGGLTKSYLHCRVCDLVFLNPAQRVDLAAERQHYGLHQNNISDDRYCQFLRKLIDPLIAQLKREGATDGCGLDFGCGPGPVLAELCRQHGYRMQVYDPFFADDKTVLQHEYDFVTCSEVVEHFHHPGAGFGQLNSLIRKAGWLAVMTGMIASWDGFADWHYHRDVTHVSFYSATTMAWIAKTFHWQLQVLEPNVVIFRKM